jgi:hypothetical protein
MMQLTAGFRVDETCDSFFLGELSGGTLYSRTIPHGIYLTPESLAAEFEAWAQSTLDPSATVTVTHNTFTFAWPGDVVLVWPSSRLRDAVGFTGDVDTPASATAPNPWQASQSITPSLPWSAPSPLSWRLALARAPTWRGTGRAILRGLHRQWAVTARVTAAELAQLRSVLASMLAGLPATLWLDVETTDPWGAADPYGYVHVWLAPESREYVERWMSLPARLAVEIDLTFAEYVAP